MGCHCDTQHVFLDLKQNLKKYGEYIYIHTIFLNENAKETIFPYHLGNLMTHGGRLTTVLVANKHMAPGLSTIRPTELSERGSGFLLRKNGADQPRLNSVAQLGSPLSRVENGNKY